MHLYGYRILERKSSAPHGDVYFAVRESDGLPVVLKSCPKPPPPGISRAQREFELLRQVESERVARAVALETQETHDILVVERHPGSDLAEFAAKHSLDTRSFLELAAQCAEALTDIHAARIIHKDIKPANLLVAPETGALTVIDFGISAALGEARGGDARARVEGTLAYLSPEQTGRIDAGIDFRSDLYSLGATLYELLTGRPPFDDASPEEMVHAHLAVRPRAPIERNPEISPVLSRIVVRLLEKDPEERYQTAQGLRADLISCLKEFLRSGSIDPNFVLGRRDAPHRLRMPKRLYGRAKPLADLTKALDRARSGLATFVCLVGPPGIGKTALAESVRLPHTAAGGYFARAKFDRYRRDRPYAGFVDAFESIFEQILAQSKDIVDTWSEHLALELGNHGTDLADTFPGLALLLPEVQELPKIPAAERQARLGASLNRLVRAIATREHPVVILLDDLQWADAGSRFLFEELIGMRETAHLLLLSTVRESSRDRADPWFSDLMRMANDRQAFEEIQLGPIEDSDVTQWLSDALGRAPNEVAWLARRVAIRTGRSPQLIQEFLGQLQDNGALFAGPSGWEWDEAAADAAAMSDEAVNFASRNIDVLDDSARRLLFTASCIGDVFDPEFLLEVVGVDRVQGFRDLMTLSNSCFLTPCREGFRFVHDRLREAASARQTADEQSRTHRQIGIALLRRTKDSKLGPQAMRIADHLNRAGDPASDAERIHWVTINLAAGTSALASHSPELAEDYLRAAQGWFTDADWDTHFKLGFDLYFRLVNCVAGAGRPEEAERYLSFLESRPLDIVHWARVAARRIDLRTTTYGPPSGIEAGLKAFDHLGIRFPDKTSTLRMRIEVLRTRLAMRNPRALLTRSPATSDPDWTATQLIVTAFGTPSFREDMRAHLLALSYFIRGQIRRGAGVPALSLTSFAHSQATFTGDYATASRLGELAIRAAIEFGDTRIEVQVQHMLNVLIHPWWKPRRELLAQLQSVTDRCFDLGIRELALYSKLWHAVILLTLGEPLSLVEHEIGAHLSLAKRVAPTSWALRLGVLSALAPLTGAPGPPGHTSGRGDMAHELPSEAAVLLATSRHYNNIIGTINVMTLYLLGRVEEAFFRSEQLARKMLHAGGSTPHVSEFELFYALCAAGMAGATRGTARKRALRVLRQCERSLRRRAKSAPFNFDHLVPLIAAERLLVRRRLAKAERLYRQAEERARINGFPNHETLICDRLATLLLTSGKRTEGHSLRLRAIEGYERWGAHVKAGQLRHQRHRIG